MQGYYTSHVLLLRSSEKYVHVFIGCIGYAFPSTSLFSPPASIVVLAGWMYLLITCLLIWGLNTDTGAGSAMNSNLHIQI